MNEFHPPLSGITVLDFAQFLAGPAAALRLADLGADVIKIERPHSGDLCRQLAVADAYVEGDSLLFHTFNRNKRSATADLKTPADLQAIKRLITTADVMIHNFRPGVMEKIGLGYDIVSRLNPRLVYAAVTGYGDQGPWRDKPGQDLLAQALSGLTWLSGEQDGPPVPVGLPVLDMAAGAALVQGILAALVRRGTSGKGALIEVDLLSVAVDMQYEPFTVFLNREDGQPPTRCRIANANVYSAAPYGLYATADGYLALAMVPLARLADLIELPALREFNDSEAYSRRDDIKRLIADRLAQRASAAWLAILEPADIWCAEVLDWRQLTGSQGFAALDMVQEVQTAAGTKTRTTCCPIKVDGRRLKSPIAAPPLGRHTEEVINPLKRKQTP